MTNDQNLKKNFIRKKEDFVCEHCGELVVGDGYTDHCPKCLWAKHVDRLIPGDRESDCKGMMEPIGTKFKIQNSKFKINYRCNRCGHEFGVREGKGDDREKLMGLML
ncbi:RNHCP domain-containing protein [Candidatus Shapirobacteria bacterium]|nr:RNHCP domain-containing protein [Candidatus Shapirobacteria bacterium]